MAATVRIFYHQGFRRLGDSHVLDQPYLDSALLHCDTVLPATTIRAPAGALVASVEVQPGKAVYCEINPPGRGVLANEGSPMISGKTLFPIGQGWSISVLEAQI